MKTQKQFFNIIKQFMGQTNVLTIPRTLLEFCDNKYTDALLLGQLVYWQEKIKNKHGYVYKSAEDWENEIGISSGVLKRTKKRLITKKWIVVTIKKANGNPTSHYKLTSIFYNEFYKFLNPKTENTENDDSQNDPDRLGQNDTNGYGQNDLNSYGQNDLNEKVKIDHSITETTTEITTEITKDSPKKNSGKFSKKSVPVAPINTDNTTSDNTENNMAPSEGSCFCFFDSLPFSTAADKRSGSSNSSKKKEPGIWPKSVKERIFAESGEKIKDMFNNIIRVDITRMTGLHLMRTLLKPFPKEFENQIIKQFGTDEDFNLIEIKVNIIVNYMNYMLREDGKRLTTINYMKILSIWMSQLNIISYEALGRKYIDIDIYNELQKELATG